MIKRLNQIAEEKEKYEKELREKTPYDIDGLVIRVNSIKKQKGFLRNKAQRFP